MISARMLLRALLVVGWAVSGDATAQGMGETIWIPMQDRGIFSTTEIKLEATLHKPRGDGPFPVVVFSHGSTGPFAIPNTLTLNPYGFGQYLIDKGIALLSPMRRGRGKSEGRYDEPYKCGFSQAEYGINYASASLDAAFVYLKSQKWANLDKVVLAGQSRGGILSVIYAANNPTVAQGVMNFSGGWMGDGCNVYPSIPVTLFKEAGAKLKTPTLFLYAHGDRYYSDASIEKYADAFRSSGGDIEFKFYTLEPGVDGHSLFDRYLRIWTSDTDVFLKRAGLWDGISVRPGETRVQFCSGWHDTCKRTCPAGVPTASCHAVCEGRLQSCESTGCYHFNNPGPRCQTAQPAQR